MKPESGYREGNLGQTMAKYYDDNFSMDSHIKEDNARPSKGTWDPGRV
jgi:hypothetical protein